MVFKAPGNNCCILSILGTLASNQLNIYVPPYKYASPIQYVYLYLTCA